MKTRWISGMRTGLTALIAVSVMLLFATASVSAETVVSIENVSALPDEVVTADITAHDVTNLTQFGIKLEYDASVVNATSAENNPNLPDMFGDESLHDFRHASEGWVVLMCNPSTATPVSGAEVVLTTVTLKAVGDAEDVSPLDITVTSLKNAAGDDISYTAEDGEFTIQALPPSPVKIENAHALLGEETTTRIIASDVTNLTQFGIKLEYDASVVNATSAENNPNLPDMFGDVSLHDFSHASEGWVVLMCNPSTATPVSGAEVVLTTVTLKAVGDAEDVSPLDITVTSLKNAAGDDISSTDVDGTFTILVPPTLTSIEVEPPTATVNVGDTQQFTATAYDQYAAEMPAVLFTWTSSREAVGTVDETTGLFTANAVGTTTITATNGTVSGTAEVTVVLAPTPTPSRVHRGHRGGAPRDSDGDGILDIKEMLAGTDPNDPCDPNPECAACLAIRPPTPTPTPTPTPVATPSPTLTPTVPPPGTPAPTPTPTPAPSTPTPKPPGFEAVFAIAGLLTVAYLVLRRKKR